jgi:glycosyltransferase involved in cell wall biosynthesis
MLLQNADLRNRFGAAGRERVICEFDLDRCVKVLEKTYARISGRRIPERVAEVSLA